MARSAKVDAEVPVIGRFVDGIDILVVNERAVRTSAWDASSSRGSARVLGDLDDPRALDPTGDWRAQRKHDQFLARPKFSAVMIRAIAQPAADSKGTLTMIMATGFGRNFTPSVPRTYAPIGRM